MTRLFYARNSLFILLLVAFHSCASSKFIILPKKDTIIHNCTGYLFSYDDDLYFIPSNDTSYNVNIFNYAQNVYALELKVLSKSTINIFCVPHFIKGLGQNEDSINSSFIEIKFTVDSISMTNEVFLFGDSDSGILAKEIHGNLLQIGYKLISDRRDCQTNKPK